MVNHIRSYISHYQGFNRNVRLFLIGNFLFQIGLGIFMVIYNLYIQEIGHAPNVNGQIISVTSLATAIALVPAGIWSDRIGRKPVILIGGLLAAFSLVIRSVVMDEVWLLISAFFTGFFSAFVQVTAVPLLAENSRIEQRMHLFTLNFALIMVAQVIGNFSGGFFSDLFHYGFGFSALESIRISLLGGCALVVIGFYPLFLIREKREATSANHHKSLKAFCLENKSQTGLVFKFTVANLIIGVGAGLVIPYLNLYFSDRFQASHSAIGIVVSLGQAATALAMVIGPWLVSRIGEVRSVAYLQLASIPFLLITGLSTNFFIASAGFLIRQALMNAANPIISTMIMEKVDNRLKGLANSMGQMVFMLGWAVTGPVSTYMVASYGSYWGYAVNFALTSVIYVMGAWYFYLAFKEKKGASTVPVRDENSAAKTAS